MVPVNCDDGYEINGNKFITCLFNGDWSSVICQPKGKFDPLMPDELSCFTVRTLHDDFFRES